MTSEKELALMGCEIRKPSFKRTGHTIRLGKFAELPFWKVPWVIHLMSLNGRIQLLYDCHNSLHGVIPVDIFYTATALRRVLEDNLLLEHDQKAWAKGPDPDYDNRPSVYVSYT